MQPLAAAAVVPAYNEEKTVGAVVAVLRESGLFREIIVVSDGSTDGTVAAARAAGATLVHELSRNRGKGAAMSHAVMHTDAAFIAFFDADLRGLTVTHVRTLLEPVTSGLVYMHVGMRDRGPLRNALARRLPWVSGERALRRELFDAIPTKYLAGFKVEVALNFYCKVNGLPMSASPMRGLGIITKAAKVGVLRSLPQYAAMWARVALAMVEVRLARHRFEGHGTHMSHWHR